MTPPLELSVLRSVQNLLSLEEGLRVQGPFLGREASCELSEILAFRLEENALSAPHLFSERQIEIEARLRLDERSFHFGVWEGDRVVASIRLTPRPFETEALEALPKPDLSGLAAYFEFSRLTTLSGHPRKALVARQLLYTCGSWMFRSTSARGLFGICRPSREGYFARFGVGARAGTSFRLAGRGDSEYRLVAGDRDSILRAVLALGPRDRRLNTRLARALHG